ncbi:MAG: chemotaxis protein CheW, partial [Rhodocyclaceae bacterium]
MSQTSLIENVDARTKLAGSNRMEILLFSLGTHETFGINVFKVREVCKTPEITKTPHMPPGVEGLISLRGNVFPVLSLAKVMHLADAPHCLGDAMMVAEYSKRTLGFLVSDVDRIIRVDWDRVRGPESVTHGGHHYITAITELDDGRLVSIVDVEQIMADTFGEAMVGQIDRLADAEEYNVFFVDDSAIARKKIIEVLDKM